MPKWILVADNSRARIFSAEKAASPLNEVQTLAFPEARLHEGDLITDKGGRRGESGPVSAHSVKGENVQKQGNAERFASMICATLEEARMAGSFSRLYVVAAPAFLGLLRKRLPQTLRQLIAAEIDKNLTTQEPHAIRRILPEYL